MFNCNMSIVGLRIGTKKSKELSMGSKDSEEIKNKKAIAQFYKFI